MSVASTGIQISIKAYKLRLESHNKSASLNFLPDLALAHLYQCWTCIKFCFDWLILIWTYSLGHTVLDFSANPDLHDPAKEWMTGKVPEIDKIRTYTSSSIRMHGYLARWPRHLCHICKSTTTRKIYKVMFIIKSMLFWSFFERNHMHLMFLLLS